jgi:hypothetical protein
MHTCVDRHADTLNPDTCAVHKTSCLCNSVAVSLLLSAAAAAAAAAWRSLSTSLESFWTRAFILAASSVR